MKIIRAIVIISVLLATHTILGADWPQYLGPNRNSTSEEKGILRSWPENGPEILWAVEGGTGFGGPVVKDGKVYLLDRDDEVGDTMRCFDLSSGKELWNFGYKAPETVMFPGSRSVPVVDGNYVYSSGHNGDLYCINIDTHKPVWNKNIWTDFGGDELPIWAITQCPIIYDDLLIVLSQAPSAGAVAYNKLTGDFVWKTPNLGNESYASPFSVPSALDAGNNKVLVVGGYELGTVMLEVKKQADGNYVASEVFRTEEFGDQTKPPILYNGYFYAQYGTNSRRDGLACMSMDGQIMWKTKRNPRISPDGRWMAYTSDESGQNQVYVHPYPDVEGGRWQVSATGGDSPLWSGDGGELFYRVGDEVMAVPIKTEPAFSIETPKILFRGNYVSFDAGLPNLAVNAWDIRPDGKRFLMMKDFQVASETPAASFPRRLNIVLNWFEELKEQVPIE